MWPVLWFLFAEGILCVALVCGFIGVFYEAPVASSGMAFSRVLVRLVCVRLGVSFSRAPPILWFLRPPDLRG